MSVINRARLSWPKAAIGIAVLVGVGAIVTIVAAVSSLPSRQSAFSGGDGRACAADNIRPGRLAVLDGPCPLPGGATAATFADGTGQPLSLADFQGKVVLVNLWATWCPPCIKEMPALDALQAQLGGPEFVVLAVSQDAGGVSLPRHFLETSGLTNLGLYVDPDGAMSRAIDSPGLPTSVLLDRDGHEIARLVGATEWDSPEMVEELRKLGGF